MKLESVKDVWFRKNTWDVSIANFPGIGGIPATKTVPCLSLCLFIESSGETCKNIAALQSSKVTLGFYWIPNNQQSTGKTGISQCTVPHQLYKYHRRSNTHAHKHTGAHTLTRRHTYIENKVYFSLFQSSSFLVWHTVYSICFTQYRMLSAQGMLVYTHK